jgi:hypothetical protein
MERLVRANQIKSTRINSMKSLAIYIALQSVLVHLFLVNVSAQSFDFSSNHTATALAYLSPLLHYRIHLSRIALQSLLSDVDHQFNRFFYHYSFHRVLISMPLGPLVRFSLSSHSNVSFTPKTTSSSDITREDLGR